MNIKKSNGKKESEETDLMKYAKNDREQLFDQLKITSPTVIICGNTLKYLETITDQKIKTKNSNRWQSVNTLKSVFRRYAGPSRNK